MLRINKILSLSIGGLLLTGMAINANAQVEILPSQTFTGATDFNGSFLFTKFNPSLGTLNDVVVTLSDGFSTSIKITNSSGSTSTGNVQTDVSDILYDSTTTVTTPGNILTATGGIFNTSDEGLTPKQSFSVPAGTNQTLPTKAGSATNGGQTFTDNTTLNFFTGSSGNVQIFYQTLTQTNLSTTNGNTAASQVTTDTLHATIEYDYTLPSTSTPEPGTWAMLVAGASTGLVALRRRRNKK